MVEEFFCCPAEDDDDIQVNNSEGEFFRTPVISSSKYVGVCRSQKGTLMYLYFPNGEVNAVWGIEDSSKGIWWYPAHRSNVGKYFDLFN